MSAKLMIPLYSRILTKFPPFNFCFAYGSAVKKQLNNNSKEDNMIDFVFCVDNPLEWHELNLKQNYSHYSSLKYFGHNFITKFQENFGAKIYFNTLVPLEDVTIKYGVISTENLITDLLEWSNLYLAGRLHKPVEILKPTTNSEVQMAIQLNLQSAVHSALLILPQSFTEYQFYYTLSNLSYAGDFRMIFGEKKTKVENIVKPQINLFRQLYKPILKTLSEYTDFPGTKDDTNSIIQDPSKIMCSQDISPFARLHHLNQLPRWPQKSMTRCWNRGSFRQDTEDVLRAIAYDPYCDEIVMKCLSEIVWKSSISQSIKGIATAGFFKSVRYSGRKINKMLI